MKLDLDERLPKGVSHTYTGEGSGDRPEIIERLLAVPGVQSVFHMADFMAVQKTPRGDWERILSQVRAAFGDVPAASPELGANEQEPEPFGEVRVAVQMFRGIPMLVKVSAGADVRRVALPARFAKAVERAASAAANMLAERRWADQGARYGELGELGPEIVEELQAAYDDERLEQLVAAALAGDRVTNEATESNPVAVGALPDDSDWRVRYAALEKTRPRPEAIALFTRALHDSKSSVRRLAAAYLGLTGDPAAVTPLCDALTDAAVTVRRTAGDALSDLADPRAIVPMTTALTDANKLVRWRAARFLFEVGDESALPALRAAREDVEFEVRMQIRLAIERIEGGQSPQGPVWQQMTR